uniref:Uncharacterized protein n=1 Tax=Klebsiella pneumoniae TaxID=573 RepID=A0A6G7SMK2_KLEPN|nr:hypothetical protein [Klebsiella pneumoniae]
MKNDSRLICAITVVSVLHSVLKDVQPAFRHPSSLYMSLFS